MSPEKEDKSHENVAGVTIEVPIEQVQEFKDFLDNVCNQSDASLTSKDYCCYLSIRSDYSSEKHRQIAIQSTSLNNARIQCARLAYDEYNGNNQVSSIAEAGRCRFIP